MTDDLRLRFMIVDDEQSIRRLCMTVGTRLGFRVQRGGKRRSRGWNVWKPLRPILC